MTLSWTSDNALIENGGWVPMSLGAGTPNLNPGRSTP